jgi:hypothetical protein
MGRTPDGEQALTGAERQARYRLRLGPKSARTADQAKASAVPGRPVRTRALSRRWHDAVAGLVALQAEYARWLDALPEATRDTAGQSHLEFP